MRLSGFVNQLRTIHEFLFRPGDSEPKYGASSSLSDLTHYLNIG